MGEKGGTCRGQGGEQRAMNRMGWRGETVGRLRLVKEWIPDKGRGIREESGQRRRNMMLLE
jgi:hypothetical protein